MQRQGRRDRIIQETDVDALASRYSAVCRGYIEDDYIQTFVDTIKSSGSSATSFTPKLPLINRGTYARTHAIDLMIKDFVENAGGRQIISLGAGSDTRPFGLLQKYENLTIHELDFAVSTARKSRIIRNNKQLSGIIGLDSSSLLAVSSDAEIETAKYYLHAIDLRTVTEESSLLKGMDPSLTTLILSECCLCYLEPDNASKVIKWFVGNFEKMGIIIYEPIGGDDQFGMVMKQNLSQRGISLPTLNKYPTLEAEVVRLKELGLVNAAARDILQIHDNWLTAEDHRRIDKLDFLDEREELNLLLKHYCVAWAASVQLASWSVSKFGA